LHRKAIREIDNLIFEFIWNGKRAKIKRSILKKDISSGGPNIPDFETMVKASPMKWRARIRKGTESTWCHILQHYLSQSSIDLNVLLHANVAIERRIQSNKDHRPVTNCKSNVIYGMILNDKFGRM